MFWRKKRSSPFGSHNEEMLERRVICLEAGVHRWRYGGTYLHSDKEAGTITITHVVECGTCHASRTVQEPAVGVFRALIDGNIKVVQ